MSPPTPVLLVESDRHFAASLARELAADGYRVELAHSFEEASARAAHEPPRLLLLGHLPGRQAHALLGRIHAAAESRVGSAAPPGLLVLGTAAGGLEALRAFEAGADDFIARPLSYLELRARMRALLRRLPVRAETTVLAAAAVRVDLQARSATVECRPLELTRIELDLLTHLVRAPERVFTREELLRAVWGFRSAGVTRTVDTHASRLRRKLAAASAGDWIVAVRGVGYRLS